MVARTPRGLVIIHTGDGKGKTTAALGMAVRAVGHGLRIAFVQFIKASSTGEHEALSRLAPNLQIFRMGRGLVIDEATPEHVAAAHEALAFVRTCLTDGQFDLVVADEILVAAGLNLLAREEVESLLAARPPAVHLILTGRGAWDALVERADLVTEMRLVKHPYQQGIEAQAGVEF